MITEYQPLPPEDLSPEGRANHHCCYAGHEGLEPFPIARWLMILIAIAILLPLALAQVIRWL